MSLEIDAGDVIKLILQFCKENALPNTLRTLQEESQTPLNVVDDLDSFLRDVNLGNWDKVLPIVGTLKLPNNLLVDFYEHIVLELIELKEYDTARAVLRTSAQKAEESDDSQFINISGPLYSMKIEHPDRYLRLERLLQKPNAQSNEIYGTISKEKRRTTLSAAIAKEIESVQPSRLLTLLTQSLKYQQSQSSLPLGATYDLFHGTAPTKVFQADSFPTAIDKTIKFGSKSYAECARFSPDGQYLISGSVDGFVEVWNYTTGRLMKENLKYQAEDQFMMHESAVLCLTYSSDSKFLASGSQDGKIKVWQIKTGKCIRKIEPAHSQGVTCIVFSKDGTQLLSGSFDHTLRLHGLKSEKTLRIFRDHTSYINDCMFSHDESRVISTSSDGTARIWDAKTAECLLTFRPHAAPRADSSAPPKALSDNGVEAAVLTVAPFPFSKDEFLVCTRSSTLYVMNWKGQLLRTYQSEKMVGSRDFVSCCVSPKGNYVFGVAEDAHLYCFNTQTGMLEHVMKVHDKDVIGMCHHPIYNLVATYSDEGLLKLWR